MQKTQILAAAATAAIVALAACNGEPEVVTINKFDPQAEALKNAAPVEPPPMIQASRAYRCRDNALFFVDFYTNNTAMIRTRRGGEGVRVAQENGTGPYAGSGYSVSANADHVQLTAPGHGSQACHT
jgi:hypothetical protein